MPSDTPPTFKPTLILHGGAGAIHRESLPPDLYAKYHASLQSYLRSTRDLLYNGNATALDAAVHAVSLLEDDDLFNAGRGSVFTKAGTIEMEASIMVANVYRDDDNDDDFDDGDGGGGGHGGGIVKRGVGVTGLRSVRHPIRLAREVLLRTGRSNNGQDGGNMHSQLVGPYVEEMARGWGLEFMDYEWFWTKKRWEEHCRGLKNNSVGEDDAGGEGEGDDGALSQGTVGCVCLDQWGGLAVAMSTGGLTNQWPGRIGDTSTLGAGFWAESWNTAPLSSTHDQNDEQDEEEEEEEDGANEKDTLVEKPPPPPPPPQSPTSPAAMGQSIRSLFANYISSSPFANKEYTPLPTTSVDDHQQSNDPSGNQHASSCKPNNHPQRQQPKRRATALSCTGNGDSILRIAAARTVSAMLRYSAPSSPIHTLSNAVTAVAGPDGEAQRSAGKRWAATNEGEAGIIGIEVEAESEAGDEVGKYKDGDGGDEGGGKVGTGKVVFDFNCGGMWRAWVDEGERERVMVFKDEYK